MNANDKLTATLEVQQWLLVLNALGKIPYEQVAGLIKALEPQLVPPPARQDNVVPMGESA